MKIWSWYGAGDGFAAMLPVRKEDIFIGTFSADGTPKIWATRPQVKPGIERDPKKQKPVGDLSPLIGASVVMNKKAHAALKDFLGQFGEFLELDLVDETGLAGGDQPLFFYNVTNVIAAVDPEKSKKDEGGIAVPKFARDSVPGSAQVFKDPLLLKRNIFLNDPASRRAEGPDRQGRFEGLEFSRGLTTSSECFGTPQTHASQPRVNEVNATSIQLSNALAACMEVLMTTFQRGQGARRQGEACQPHSNHFADWWKQRKTGPEARVFVLLGGEGGIRTHGTLRYA